MIQIDSTTIQFSRMGLFTCDGEWIHPQFCETTYEIIYVIEGTVYLEEDEHTIILQAGDLVILRPHLMHRGYQMSYGKTSFYWTHFFSNHSPSEHPPQVVRNFTVPSLFKELLHFSYLPDSEQIVKDSILLHLLCVIQKDQENRNLSSLASNVFEWTRINIRNGMTVQEVAAHFGYNGEYLSRLMKNQYGHSLKSLIDEFLIQKAKEYLSTTFYSVKEISAMLGFSSANSFTQFFKYHEQQSPIFYRNRYFHTYMNNC